MQYVKEPPHVTVAGFTGGVSGTGLAVGDGVGDKVGPVVVGLALGVLVVGDVVGETVGENEGDVVGESVGEIEGDVVVGDVDGDTVGLAVGDDVDGDTVGLAVGDDIDGDAVGLAVGDDVDGDAVGLAVGDDVDGDAVGLVVGDDVDGDAVGDCVGERESTGFTVTTRVIPRLQCGPTPQAKKKVPGCEDSQLKASPVDGPARSGAESTLLHVPSGICLTSWNPVHVNAMVSPTVMLSDAGDVGISQVTGNVSGPPVVLENKLCDPVLSVRWDAGKLAACGSTVDICAWVTPNHSTTPVYINSQGTVGSNLPRPIFSSPPDASVSGNSPKIWPPLTLPPAI
mmetsp:Transcript_3581/g.11157  ORF Transcript_3581/g.11157 Transcript_3581/m.11157 type:complete len:341 (-) Transcript_3581:2449-3471(-)